MTLIQFAIENWQGVVIMGCLAGLGAFFNDLRAQAVDEPDDHETNLGI